MKETKLRVSSRRINSAKGKKVSLSSRHKVPSRTNASVYKARSVIAGKSIRSLYLEEIEEVNSMPKDTLTDSKKKKIKTKYESIMHTHSKPNI